jgi:hypothetical protein
LLQNKELGTVEHYEEDEIKENEMGKHVAETFKMRNA